MTTVPVCLAIETATDVASVAACRNGTRSLIELPDASASVRDVYQSIEQALVEIGASLAGLDCIAFGCGPGSFTGVRIATAVAQSLAFGLGLPVCRVSTLEILAAGARRHHGANVVAACLDAKRQQAYLGVYGWRDGGQVHTMVPDRLVDPETFRINAGDEIFAAGSGWAAYPEFLGAQSPEFRGIDTGLRPSAEDLLDLAVTGFQNGDTVVPEAALPNYLREQVADPPAGSGTG